MIGKRYCEHREFVEIQDGTTIQGKHLHIFECLSCGLFDYHIEEIR